MMQRSQLRHAASQRFAAASTPRAAPRPQRARRALHVAAAASLPDNPSRSVLEAFYYGKAFATVLNTRLGELAASALGDASRAATDLPLQLQKFQDEVQSLVREELGAAGAGAGAGPAAALVGGAPAGSSSGGGALPTGGAGDGVRGYNTAPTDLQAIVDELRADIAASRAVLQQLKSQQQ
ncbi:hypothetical protein MNEG_6916 [Monoraphidium neglectum]|uniref:Uncharacterized protein n=1 Tax=Monoraphidium neglectum TaxID=145388 RepID=A0A0D2MKC4_9CHLO|nr:hypothetical protein MNEG_6916 [Monoraphidium neglectum]KIZ01047.1 hypothetical protein MNEG_6916 [Monoraphidium neglectum]|eukprot:XP_013900066.1 hypothetical protein MNEG_6916 [Monoraphidium neglectum]